VTRNPDRPPLTRTARFAWAAVAVLLVGVIALVVFALTDTPVTVRVVHRTVTAPAVLHSLATVPAATFNTVGVTGQPRLRSASGKPEIFFVGAEYCPFCAAERWAVVVALARFGTFGALDDMQSSNTSVFPGVQTFSFVHASYTSRYVDFNGIELYSNVPDAHGVYTRIATLTSAQQATVDRYRSSVGTTEPFPFVDVDNVVVAPSAGFSPSTLERLSQGTIVGDLKQAVTPESRAIVASANYLTAGICTATHQQPASVCLSKGVRAADEALGLA
jgi:thiol-disulfide isomerase/thioredoxin